MTNFFEPEEVDYPLTTKEGWAESVAETVAPPVVLPSAALQRLPEAERVEYDRAREDYHSQLVIVSTPTIRDRPQAHPAQPAPALRPPGTDRFGPGWHREDPPPSRNWARTTVLIFL